MKKFFIAVILAPVFVVSCKDKSKRETDIEKPTTEQSPDNKRDSLQKANTIRDSIQSVRRKDSALLKLTQTILTNLKGKNYSLFANHIHPAEGIRFSPYGYIDTVKHIKFSKASFLAQAHKTDQDMFVWGEFDGTGDPIKMTLNNYLQRFVYDVDFAKPEQRSVNKFLGFGNSLNNLLEVYKNSDFSESYFSGFEKKYEGHDWRTLRLVFKERNKRFYLVGVVHDEWTI